MYLAPVVMHRTDGTPFYQLALFVVCFDTNTIFVIDPEQAFNLLLAPIGIISTGVGPYALAFDPFLLEDAATNAVVPLDTAAGRERWALAVSLRLRGELHPVVRADDRPRPGRARGRFVPDRLHAGQADAAKGSMTMSRTRFFGLMAGALGFLAAGAAAIASCSQTPTNVPVRTFEQAQKVDVVCMQVNDNAGNTLTRPIPSPEAQCAAGGARTSTARRSPITSSRR